MMSFDYPAGATTLDPKEADGLKLKHITTEITIDGIGNLSISE